MTARETAERHAQDMVDGNFQRLMGDFAGSAFAELMGSGAMPPRPTTEWSILSETEEGDSVRFHVCYSNETERLELETIWRQVDSGAWKIVKAEAVTG